VADPRSQRGVALLAVLLGVALLTVIVLEFTYQAQVEYRRAVAWVRVRQARLIADSGLAIAAEMLARGPLLYSMQYGGDEKKADGLAELWAQRCEDPGPHVCPANVQRSCTLDTFDAFRLGLRIRDETGYYNLNRLVRGGEPERRRFAELSARLAVQPSFVDGVMRWTSRSSRGASVPYSTPRGLAAGSYPVRAGPLATFGELAFVPGVRAADLIELRRLATVLDPKVAEINVNTAPLGVLAALHSQLQDETLLAQLQAARCQRPFADKTELRTALGATSRLPFEELVTYKSELFRIEAVGNVDDLYQSVEALVSRPYDENNRTEWRVELIYYLPRRGSLIDPAMWERPSALDEFTAGAPPMAGPP
jgi:type II secretory pathway component PulK